MATWSLILGLVSWICAPLVAAIPAVVLGHRARRPVCLPDVQLKQYRLALGGLILGYANIAAALVVLADVSALFFCRPETAVRVVQGSWLDTDEAQRLNVRTVTFSLEGLRGWCGHRQTCVRKKLLGLDLTAEESPDGVLDFEDYISITADGSVEFNEAPIATRDDHRLAELKRKLVSLVQKFGARIPIVVVSQDSTSCQRLADVLTACETSGAKRVRVIRHRSAQEIASTSYPDIPPPPPPPSSASSPPPPPPEPPPLRVTRLMDEKDTAALKTHPACIVGDILWTPGIEGGSYSWVEDFTTRPLSMITDRRNASAGVQSVLAAVRGKIRLPLDKMGAKTMPDTVCLRVTENCLRALRCSDLGRLREGLTDAGVRYLLLMIYAPTAVPDR